MPALIKHYAKKLARLILGEYAAFYIYTRAKESRLSSQAKSTSTYSVKEIDEPTIKHSPNALIQEQAWYAGPGTHAYACLDGDRIVGLCFYWYGERYLKRNFWPLADGEAKLVQIISLPEMRGRGVATALIKSSFQDMIEKGFSRMYARIWHSNSPSIRAFERAGWARIALVLEINPLRQRRPIRLRFDSAMH